MHVFFQTSSSNLLYKYWLNNLEKNSSYINLVMFAILQHKMHSFKLKVSYCCIFEGH